MVDFVPVPECFMGYSLQIPVHWALSISDHFVPIPKMEKHGLYARNVYTHFISSLHVTFFFKSWNIKAYVYVLVRGWNGHLYNDKENAALISQHLF